MKRPFVNNQWWVFMTTKFDASFHSQISINFDILQQKVIIISCSHSIIRCGRKVHA